MPATPAAQAAGFEPLLSIVVPAYGARMLRECLTSVAGSVPPGLDCEIVIVDDASPEDLKAIVEPFAAADNRIRFTRNGTNLGIPANFNHALTAGRGKYLCMMGDDVGFFPGNFEIKLSILENNPEVGLVYSRWTAVDDHQQARYTASGWHAASSYVGGRREFRELLLGNYINLASAVFRRSLFERHGGFDERLLVLCDWDMFLQWVRHTDTAFVAQPLVWVREHQYSDTQKRDIGERLSYEGKLAVWRKWLLEKADPPLVDNNMWDSMEWMLKQDFVAWHIQDQPDVLEPFKQLRREVEVAASRRFAVQTRDVSAVLCSAGTSSAPQLLWSGPLWDATGYGSDLRTLVEVAAADARLDVRIEPVYWQQSAGGGELLRNLVTTEERARLEELTWNPVRKGPHLSILNGWPVDVATMEERSRTVLRTVSDFDTLPQGWPEACNQFRAVWVPNLTTLARMEVAGVDPVRIRILPECVDTDYFCPGEELAGGPFTFLSVADWHPRDAHEVLLRAFIEEFDPDEPVRLLLALEPRGRSVDDITRAIQQLAANSGKRALPTVQVQVGPKLAEDRRRFYRSGHVFVNSSRADSWRRATIEAMACQLPVIGVRWGGNLEFAAYPVDCELVPLPVEAKEGRAGELRWAEPSLDSLRLAMRRSYANPGETAARGRDARQIAIRRHSTASVAGRLQELIREAA